MNTHRTAAIIVGILYIIGTVAGVLSVVVTSPVLNNPNDLVKIAAEGNRLVVGALLVLTMGLTLAFVPIVLYPIARKHSELLALGYVVFRGALETIAYIAMVIPWLALLGLGRNAGQAGAADTTAARAMGAVLLAAHDAANNVLIVVFCLGALMLYTLLYRSRLIPRWLSIWGLVTIVMHLATIFAILFTGVDPMSTTLLALDFPIFLQEMVMAIWLIVKGFSASAIDPEAAAPSYELRADHARAGA